jgi:hypothetical protein
MVRESMGNEETRQRSTRTFQACHADRKTFRIVVPSTSDAETQYEITGSFVDGIVNCTCPGFKFRGTCKHLTVEIEECGWNGLESSEPQTLEQKEAHICPRCGSKTVDSARGDF